MSFVKPQAPPAVIDKRNGSKGSVHASFLYMSSTIERRDTIGRGQGCAQESSRQKGEGRGVSSRARPPGLGQADDAQAANGVRCGAFHALQKRCADCGSSRHRPGCPLRVGEPGDHRKMNVPYKWGDLNWSGGTRSAQKLGVLYKWGDAEDAKKGRTASEK